MDQREVDKPFWQCAMLENQRQLALLIEPQIPAEMGERRLIEAVLGLYRSNFSVIENSRGLHYHHSNRNNLLVLI
jgi:hypothetical protein